jgi:hypothetical protein
VPDGHVDLRSGEERVKAWLRHAHALESIRLVA